MPDQRRKKTRRKAGTAKKTRRRPRPEGETGEASTEAPRTEHWVGRDVLVTFPTLDQRQIKGKLAAIDLATGTYIIQRESRGKTNTTVVPISTSVIDHKA